MSIISPAYRRPVWRITLDGKDLGERINPRFMDLSLNECRGDEADQLDLTLSDHDGLLEVPNRNATIALRTGQQLRVGAPTNGCRTYLAIRGGVVVDAVLGSCSTDTLSGLGPAPLAPGDRVAAGEAAQAWPATQEAPPRREAEGTVVLTASPGPRRERLADPDALFTGTWTVNAASNRVGIRLDRIDGPALEHLPDLPELRSEGIAHGSVQVPPSGQPVVFGPDHPVTGGYPVVAVLTGESIDRAGQLTPGRTVRLRLVD